MPVTQLLPARQPHPSSSIAFSLPLLLLLFPHIPDLLATISPSPLLLPYVLPNPDSRPFPLFSPSLLPLSSCHPGSLGQLCSHSLSGALSMVFVPPVPWDQGWVRGL